MAVLPVVFYHAGLGAPGGFIGVDVFFVISGFLITSILIHEMRADDFSVMAFYERRVRRLFPALFAVLALTTLSALLIMTPFDLLDYAGALAATTLFVANIWFFRETGYFTEAAELQPLLHMWSLGVEEQFYIIFPLLLLLMLRHLSSKLAVLFIILLSLASFWAADVALAQNQEAAFYLVHFRAWELLLGSLLAFLLTDGWNPRRRLSPWFAEALSLIGLAAILLPIFTYGSETAFPGTKALPPCLGAAMLIWVGKGSNTIASSALSSPPMVFVGKLSYSLYLWHWPVISLTYYALGPLTPGVGAACVAASFVLSYLTWRLIEAPVRDSRRFGRRSVLVGSGAAIALTISVSAAVSALDGLPGRMDPSFLALADSANFHHDRRDCHRVTPERVIEGDVCVRGAENVKPSFVLVGDSHADAFSPAIFAAASDLGLAGYQYTDAGFLPLPGTWRIDRRNSDIEKTEAFLSFMEARPEIRRLYVTRFWLHQMTGYTYRHEGQIWVDGAYDGSGTAYNRIATRNGLGRLAELLADRKIVLLDDVPTGEELHIRNHLRRMQKIDFASLGLSSLKYNAQREIYEPDLEALASRFPNVQYQPLFVDMCNHSLCPLFSNDTLLFRDGDHLSWKGALRMERSARDLLVRARPPTR